MTFDREDLLNEREVRQLRDTIRRSYTRDHNHRPYRYDAMWLPMASAIRGGTERRVALIALGRIGNHEDTALLIEILRGQHAYAAPASIRHHDPSRGYAAIAMGLQLRRWRLLAPEDLSPDIRRMQRLSIDALTRFAADRDTLPAIRSACMIALGLTNDKLLASRIIEAVDLSNDHGKLVASFAAVALGMLDNPAGAKLVRELLPSPKVQEKTLTKLVPMAMDESISPGQVLIRRNAALSLALLGDPQTLSLLQRHFGREHHSSMAMIRAYQWCDDISVIARLLPMLETGVDPRQAVFAAWSMGEFYDAQTIPRLSQVLLKDLNYTQPRLTDVYVRNIATQGGWIKTRQDWTYRYHAYANEFLFTVLLAKQYLK